MLLAVQALFGFEQVLLKSLDLLISEPNLALKVLNALLILFNLLRQLVLYQLNVVLVVGSLFSELVVVLFHHLVESPLSAFLLIVVPLLKSVFFCRF